MQPFQVLRCPRLSLRFTNPNPLNQINFLSRKLLQLVRYQKWKEPGDSRMYHGLQLYSLSPAFMLTQLVDRLLLYFHRIIGSTTFLLLGVDQPGKYEGQRLSNWERKSLKERQNMTAYYYWHIFCPLILLEMPFKKMKAVFFQKNTASLSSNLVIFSKKSKKSDFFAKILRINVEKMFHRNIFIWFAFYCKFVNFRKRNHFLFEVNWPFFLRKKTTFMPIWEVLLVQPHSIAISFQFGDKNFSNLESGHLGILLG